MTDLFPPYEPGDEPRRRRFQPVPLRVLLPNLVTLLSLCAGLTAMRLAIEGDDKLDRAVVFILIAAVLDGLDGRIARLLKGTSRFGAELDSLADFVSFGVAPAMILYTYSLHNIPSLGWLVALAFAMAAALRLARFNVMIDDPMRPDWQKNFFVGIPAPAGALAGLLPIYIHLVGIDRPAGFVVLEAVYALFIALMMVSRIPTYAGKTLGSRVPREWAIPLLLAVALFITLLVIHTFLLLLVITLVYLALIPLGVSRYRARERAEARGKALQPTPAPEAGEI
ncbi:CDP-diacylglycerol--serine O-phosphatidyltransferase [Alsobacter metallidurans]|nr:CDP-diacylglycerol--serine O-phosphatidyltransferase [Alsobacter metallidurans]